MVGGPLPPPTRLFHSAETSPRRGESRQGEVNVRKLRDRKLFPHGYAWPAADRHAFFTRDHTATRLPRDAFTGEPM